MGDDTLGDPEIAGGKQSDHALVRLLEQEHLAEARYVVDARIGAGVRKQDESGLELEANAIRHVRPNSPRRRSFPCSVPIATVPLLLRLILALSLTDVDRGRKSLLRGPRDPAPDRRGIARIDAAAQPDIAVGGAQPVGRIEPYPADVGYVDL